MDINTLTLGNLPAALNPTFGTNPKGGHYRLESLHLDLSECEPADPTNPTETLPCGRYARMHATDGRKAVTYLLSSTPLEVIESDAAEFAPHGYFIDAKAMRDALKGKSLGERRITLNYGSSVDATLALLDSRGTATVLRLENSQERSFPSVDAIRTSPTDSCAIVTVNPTYLREMATLLEAMAKKEHKGLSAPWAKLMIPADVTKPVRMFAVGIEAVVVSLRDEHTPEPANSRALNYARPILRATDD